MKITTKIFLSTLIVPVIVLVLGFTLFYPIAEAYIRSEIFAHLQTAAKNKANLLNSYLEERKNNIKVLASMPRIKDSLMKIKSAYGGEVSFTDYLETEDYKGIAGVLDSYFAEYKALYGYHDILLLDHEGNIVYTALNNDDLGTNIRSGPYRDTYLAGAVVSAAEDGEPVFSDYEYYPPSGMVAGFVADVVRDDEGSFHGILVMQLPVETIGEIMSERTGMGKTGETYLVGKDYLMRSDSRFFEESSILRQEVRTENALQGFSKVLSPGSRDSYSEPLISPDYRGVTVVGVNEYIPELGWVLLAEIDKAEAFEPLERLRARFLFVVAAALGISLISGFFIARGVTRPLRDLHDGAEKIGSGDTSHKVATGAKDEIGDLSRAFDGMTAKMRESQQKLLRYERMAALGELASMVGHELKSPLSMIATLTFYVKQKLDPSLKDGDISEKLDKIGVQIEHSRRIIDDILKYGRLESPEVSDCDVSDIIDETLAGIEIPDNVEVVKNTREKVPRVLVDKQQIGLVFSNLIINAIQAMPDGGRLSVSFSKRMGHCADIDVSDTGGGIPEEDLGKVFDLFYTSKSKGTGLGLAICERIIISHGGVIKVSSKLGRGTTFTVSLPFTAKKCG